MTEKSNSKDAIFYVRFTGPRGYERMGPYLRETAESLAGKLVLRNAVSDVKVTQSGV